ncbi:hypothetical protein SUDANB108_04855 [Streptomyces sp. enrichment culture]
MLVPSAAPDHQVRLEASSLVPGASGARPAVRYHLSVCGKSPFRAVLLMGGSARLSSPALTTLTEDGGSHSDPVVPTPVDGSLGRVSSGQAIKLNDVEWLSVNLQDVPRCLASTPTAPAAVASAGSPFEVTGYLREPVRRRTSLMWWTGPREAQSWPLVGRMPMVPAAELGVFNISGIKGSWVRPASFASSVSVGSLGRAAQLESSRPETESSEELSWLSRNPIAPSARLIDLDSQERWQNMLVAAGVGLGIGGSLLASLLLPAGQAQTGGEPDAASADDANAPPSPTPDED